MEISFKSADWANNRISRGQRYQRETRSSALSLAHNLEERNVYVRNLTSYSGPYIIIIVFKWIPKIVHRLQSTCALLSQPLFNINVSEMIGFVIKLLFSNCFVHSISTTLYPKSTCTGMLHQSPTSQSQEGTLQPQRRCPWPLKTRPFFPTQQQMLLWRWRNPWLLIQKTLRH